MKLERLLPKDVVSFCISSNFSGLRRAFISDYIDRQTDRQTDRKTDISVDRHTDSQISATM